MFSESISDLTDVIPQSRNLRGIFVKARKPVSDELVHTISGSKSGLGTEKTRD